ncbi:SDR family NAD(P)-dependent oxidoreductase [Chryseobacterium proteolyticum]|uniref:SDR family NAD(P)-dependent oxidoreductase n=1 Tax=Chryseobacterium proteolyticum TaxID=118127 RepID=UPI0039836687
MEDTSKNNLQLDNQLNRTDIAVIGMSCRFPGADNYHDFWNNLINGTFSVTEIPESRWDWREYYGDPASDIPKTNSKWGGFINDMDKFDPLFFNISPKEAKYIDPQHRVFLEAAWHAVEDAGYSTESLSGKKVGVYVGVSKNDYAEMLQSTHQEISSFVSTGTVHSILANRVSFFLDIRGKSEVVDTACSSSLVALHNAIRDIRSGNCESALVGGVNALITPTMYLSHGKSGMLSSEGKCKTFDESSDGYVRGEGVGCIFIKPLSAAIADNDHIIGVIKGTAVNHNGRSNSLTSPSVRAQAEVVNAALEDAALEAGNVSYIEAHGTATPLGDPIEISALKKVYSQYGADENINCTLGALKTNIGHLESAAGIAGLIKVLLCMQNGKIPGILHHKKLNPYIDLKGSPFVISTENTEWKPSESGIQSGALTAGVSSFGMGGVNAHVILQAYDGEQIRNTEENVRSYTIPLSARTEKQLKAYAERITDFIRKNGAELRIQDIAFTLQNGRDTMAAKAVFVVSDVEDLIKQLEEYISTGKINKTETDAENQLADGVRISLPGYPFERRRCWMDGASVSVATSNSAIVREVGSPLMQFLNKDQQQWEYEALLQSTNYFIRDHVVQGECMMPGVAYLEIARSVAEQACGRPVNELNDVCWMHSVKVYEENVPLQIKLTPINTGFSFEITTTDGVHSNGNVSLKSNTTSAGSIDLQKIKQRCSTVKTAEEIYHEFAKEGLAYKETFQTITEGFFASDEAICLLKPTKKENPVSSKVWEPSLLDGVFQTVVGLCIWGNVEAQHQLLPFYLKAIRCYGNLADAHYAYVKKSDTYQNGNRFSFDLFLCDEHGNVILEFNEFVKRAYKSGPVTIEETVVPVIESLHYTADWLERPLGIHAERPASVIIFDTDAYLYEKIKGELPYTTSVLVLPGDSYEKKDEYTYQLNVTDAESFKNLTKDLAEDGIVTDNWIYRWGMSRGEQVAENMQDIYALLYLSQALITAEYSGRIKLLFAYNYNDTKSAAIQQMAGGFARTLAYENPRISILTLGISEADVSSYKDIIVQEMTHYVMAPLLEVIYRNGLRQERTVVPVKQLDNASSELLLKENGCYIITGGTGGLGMVFAAYLAEHYKANIILIGRSLKNEAIEEKLQQLKQLGGNAAYYRANVADKRALSVAISKIKKKFKTINGVIHAAGLIEDSFIINKKADSFERVITPKVYGTINLDECLQNETLDFFIVFSSIASLMPNQGQCDYASANNFLDHMMEIRNRREIEKGNHGISLAINWPLWESGGITVSDEEREHLWQVFGMKPMLNEDALKGFVKLLSTDNNSISGQAVLIEGIAAKIESHLSVEHVFDQAHSEKRDSEKGDFSSVLRNMIADILPKTSVITDTDSFNKLGLDSSGLVKLSAKLTEYVGATINPVLLIEYNTIKNLAANIANEVPSFDPEKIRESLPNDTTKSYIATPSLVDAERSDVNNLLFRKRYSNEEFFMQDHVVDGKYNVPGACYIEMGRQAATLLGKRICSLSNNYWPEVLSSAGPAINAFIQMVPKGSLYAYEIFSEDTNGRKTVHAMGDVNMETSIEPGELGTFDIQAAQEKLNISISRETVYEQIIAEGLHVGPSFMPMKELWTNKEEALGHLILPLHVAETLSDYILHPSMLTGVFQTAIINNKPNGLENSKYIPVAIDEIVFTGQIPAECYVHTIAHEANKTRSGIRKFDAQVMDIEGNIIAKLNGFSIKETTNASITVTSTQSVAPRVKAVESGELAIERIESLLKALLHEGVGLEEEEMDAETSFEELGINSRMIIDLNRLLAKTFGNLSKTLFFEYRNINELAGYFQKKHVGVLKDLLGEPEEIDSTPERVEEIASVEHSTEKSTNKDIAIVGVSGKYPKSNTLSDFWDLMKKGDDCIEEIPQDRFDYKGHFDEDRENGLLYARWGGFINDVDQFDPLFFNISPREAEKIDPQERLFLEVVWSTLEDAGITREKLTEQSKKVGVFVGALWQPYVNLGIEETAKGNPVAPSGLLYSIPNRVSYFFNWTGPSMAIDTACSASLTALHYACESIRSGESESCIAGGVNLSLSLSKYLFLSQNNFLASDGRCRSFGIGDGYVPGEGIGAVLLKPLEKAIADGDQIYGVIKGTTVNHNGRTNGYTVPSPNLQGELIQSALQKTGIDPRTISYVEAHGTGTSLGDPIEMTGLCKAFDEYTDDKQFCAIGSVKSNIGHLEAAAGIAGLTKILLQFKHQHLVPSIHSATLNPNISFEDTPFYVPQSLVPWKRPLIINQNGQSEELPLRAMLSSFGAGGSNAHLIIEEFRIPEQTSKNELEQDPAIIVLSAKNEERLQEQVFNLKYSLEKDNTLSLADIAYTLQTGREAMENRVAFVVKDIPSLIGVLDDFLKDTDSQKTYTTGTCKIGTKGEEKSTEVQNRIKAGDWTGIADLWIQGFLFDWNLLYAGKQPRKISLPTYPFARERYWLPNAEGKLNPTGKIVDRTLHPLVHQNTSDLDQQQFSSTFSGEESFLADHQVRHNKILPGVAYLELARAAGKFSTHQQVTQLKEVSWINPFWVHQSETLHIGLHRQEDVVYEIYSGHEDTLITHNSGRLSNVLTAAPAKMNIQQLKKGCVNEITGSELYNAFDLEGLNLKSSFQQVETLYVAEEYALSKIKLVNNEGCVYPPCIMDSLLHAIYGLMDSYALVLPFYAGEINFYKGLEEAQELWGYAVRKKEGDNDKVVTADFYLLNENGEALLSFKDFIFLPLGSKDSDHSGIKTSSNEKRKVVYYQQEWKEEALSSEQLETANQIILIAGGAIDLCDKLQEELGLEVISINQEKPVAFFNFVLSKIKEKIKEKGRTQITIVCQNSDYPEYGFVSGLLKTAHLEYPGIKGKVLAVDHLSVKNLGELTSMIEAEQHNKDVEVAYTNGVRTVKRSVSVTFDSQNTEGITFKKGGVYLLTGGAGGLGLKLAEHICSKNNITLVLTGRSVWSETIKTLVSKIPGAVYHHCDLSNFEETQKLVHLINQEYGPLNGVIHSAGVLRDSYIINKTSLQVDEVFAAKVEGTKNIDEATKDQPLDFMVFFSSITSIKGNAGQADYAAANAYLNTYATYRNTERNSKKANGKTLSICWTLWKDGGMQVNEEDIKHLETHLGSLSLPSADGIRAFDTLLKNGKGEILVTYENTHEDVQISKIKVEDAPIAQVAIGQSEISEKVSGKIIETVAVLLKLNSAAIKRDKAFGDYGFESVSLTRFARQLNAFYELKLLPTVFYNYPTINDLKDFLMEEHYASVTQKHSSSVVVKSEEVQPATIIHKRVAFNNEGRTALPKTAVNVISNNTDTIQKAVAIIGISGRFPGSDDLDAFWKNISHNKDLITEITPDRWDWKAYYGDPLKEKNKTKAKWGGLISDIDKFDPLFFNISPREAELMDPQQRITLEAVYHALEDAAIAPDKIKGSDTSIFIGVSTSDYSMLVNNQSDLTGQGHYATGSVHSILVNRISYLLDIRGASEPVDTACSSSLIAIHRAVAHIRNGDSKMAIAGGVNALLSPELTLSFSESGMLSVDGRCKTFDESANGYVRGEGVGVVILKSLEQAEADGDHIYGIIRGSAENHGGKANTLTSPNPNAQKELLVKAYSRAGVHPADVSYIEAHGTGTSLGDPIEIEGLKLAFNTLYKQRNQTPAEVAYCSIGSVKTNIGHLEAAAGIAGVMKVILAMKHKTLPGNPHLIQTNPYLNLDGSPFRLQQNTTDWNVADNKPRIAGISSFGFGGANAHLIIEEYIPTRKGIVEGQPAVILLSAKNADRLKAKALQLKTFLQAHPDTDLHELAYTLQSGREAMEERLAWIAESQEDLLTQLENYTNGNSFGFYQGNINQEQIGFLLEGTAGKAYVETAFKNNEIKSLAQLWVKGIDVDWKLLYTDMLPKRISLPVYPFARQRYWIPDSPKRIVHAPITENHLHPLLHTDESNGKQKQYAAVYDGTESFLYDHIVNDEKILPGVAYLEIARAAGALSSQKQVVKLKNVSWLNPLKLENGMVSIAVTLDPEPTGLNYKIYNQKNSQLLYGNGLIITGEGEPLGRYDLEMMKTACSNVIPGAEVYHNFKENGLNLGKSFRGVAQINVGENIALSEIRLEELEGCMYTPGIMDSLLHTIYGLVISAKEAYSLELPYFVKEVYFYEPITDASVLWGYARKSENYKDGDQVVAYDLDLLNNEGDVLLSFKDFVALPLDGLETKVQEDTPDETVEKSVDEQITAPVEASLLKKKATDKIISIVAELVRMEPAEIENDKKFGDYGFDSILLTRFNNELNGYYDLDVMPTVFYNYATINKLAAFMTEEYTEALTALHGESPAAPIVKPVEKLTIKKTAFSTTVATPVKQPVKQFIPHQPKPQSANEPIAIIGMSGRFPGSPDLDTFWKNISENKDLITEVPADRWDWEKYDGDPLTEKNKTRSKWGGFLTDIDKFDPAFFSISPMEAELMDPQQRILMESVYEALEDGGIATESIKGTNTGIFIGVSASDYLIRLRHETDLAGQMHTTTGSVHSMMVNRISYLLDINGPSEPVDTACSSSLIAIHRAVENIRNGMCNMAIAGGVNALLSPELTLSFSQSGMLSKDGRCKTFDQSANGYVRGEGVGIIVLKSLKQAIADGDPIHAVIRSTAENHGGRANTLTSPNPIAQRDLLLHAYRSAGIDPRDVSYIEAHGTGTPLGDPIEAEGLKLAFKDLYKDKGLQQPTEPHCSIGSVKTNIGHLESAAGIASTIKVLLCMKHNTLPGNPHLKNPNEYLKLNGSIFQLRTETGPWITSDNRPKIAGISSFGFGGANSHIIIEEYRPDQTTPYQEDGQSIIILSAKTKDNLKQQVSNLLDFVQKNPEANLFDIAYTLQTGRDEMEERLALVVTNKIELMSRLTDYLSGNSEHGFTGNIKQDKTGSGNAYISIAIDNKDLNSLAGLWVKGASVDWNLLYINGRPSKINLPVYPFTKNRYWIPVSSFLLKTMANTRIHPLLHMNESDLNEQKYTSIFTGEEVFLSDHKVRKEKILPGVAYLELARIAGTLSTGQKVTQLRNISWVNPISIVDDYAKISTAIYRDGDQLCYEVYNDEEVVHGNGQISTDKLIQPEKMDINALKAKADKVLDGKGMYNEFLAAGLDLGAAYQGVQKMYADDHGCLAKINLTNLEGFMYTPGILDSMLHTIYGFQQLADETYSLALPYFMGEMSCYQTLEGQSLWAYARKNDQTKSEDKLAAYDIDLINDHGVVLVSFRNFVALPLDGFKPTKLVKKDTDTFIYQPVWEEMVAKDSSKVLETEKQFIWLAEGTDSLAETLKERLGIPVQTIAIDQPIEYFTTILEQLKSYLTKNASMHITVVYPNHQYPQAGFITGLLKTAVQENPGVTGQTIGVDSFDPDFLAELLKNEVSKNAEIRYDQGIFKTKQFRPVVKDILAVDQMAIRENGVYLITGGAGGLGQIFAKHISKTKNVKIILTGRRTADQEIEKLLSEIPGTVYYSCDITDYQDTERLLTTIKETYQGLNGIIHSAGTLRDSFILNKTQEHLQQVLHPKITGARVLDEVTKDEPLDFMMFFSSVAAVTGNAGQSDYASANTYLDHYVEYRNEAAAKGQRSGKTISLNWPLWKSGGMQVSAAGEKYLESQFGMIPMATETGLEMFDLILKAQSGQYAVYFGKEEGISRTTGNAVANTTQKKCFST